MKRTELNLPTIKSTILRNVALSVLMLCTSGLTYSQSDILKIADDHMRNGNYNAALKIYMRVAVKDSLDAVANYGAGVCILYLAMDKRPAIQYLERSLRAGIKNPEAMFFMGLAYHHNLKLELAQAAYQEYKNKEEGEMLGEIERHLMNVKNA
ncbi:MAG TPA: hypothetical protein DCX54_01075, partial [Flavobacteriales bacterium]|nr:hypothetical protein [Flavobacteriales bacterium]